MRSPAFPFLMNSVFFFFLSREREDDCGAKEKGWGGRARAGASRIHDDDSSGNETLGEFILSENTLLTRKKPNTELMSGRFAKDHALPVGMYRTTMTSRSTQSRASTAISASKSTNCDQQKLSPVLTTRFTLPLLSTM